MTTPRPCAVVFDLDGTLVQTRIASWKIFEQVNRNHGLGVDTPDEFFALFRGNIFASLAQRCRDEAHAAEVKQEFLTLLRRDYSPPLVPGMRDVVRRLASELTLSVMSSNAMAVLRRVLVDNDIAYCFAHVFGGDVAPDKRAAIRQLLADSGSGFGRRCSADYDEGHIHCVPDTSSTVLVTDTAGDVRDAREVGIRVIGVTWGMHSADELLDAGAEFVALWPQEVASHLLGDGAATPPSGACATGSCAVPGLSPTDAPSGARPAGLSSGTAPDPDRVAARGGAVDPRRQRRHDAAARWQGGDAPPPPTRDVTPPRGGGRVASPAATSQPTSAAPDELLAAVRRICDSP